jgi:hypothetical protein
MITAADLAILDLLHLGYHPPAPSHPRHDHLMKEWTQRYRARLVAAECLLAAVAALEAYTGEAVYGAIAGAAMP